MLREKEKLRVLWVPNTGRRRWSSGNVSWRNGLLLPGGRGTELNFED